MREALPAELGRSDVTLSEGAPIRERVVIAPCSGRFTPLPPEAFATEGEWVEAGQRVAEIRSPERLVPVFCSFRGWMMGMLALPGQPVHQGDALFWIWRC